MKNIQHLFKRSNLTPLERVTLLVHNDEHREKTGKDMLHPLDLNAIKDGWRGTTAEINEYNRYIGIVRLEHSMRMDARMFSYHSELALVRHQRLLSHVLSDAKRITEMKHDELMQGITEEESIDFATAHTYLEHRDTLHTFTFYNLPLEVREDLIRLDDSVSQSRQYLEDEVLLYEVFKDGNLCNKDKESLVDTIFSRLYYDGIRKLRDGTEKDGYMVGGYFAGLPLEEVMHKVAHDAGITWKDKDEEDLLEDIETYAKEK